MKPQCETTADCYTELGRVMREFGLNEVSEALALGYVKYLGDIWHQSDFLYFLQPADWSFAIAKLEDKPVFFGDTVFSTVSGSKFTAGVASDNSYWWLNYLGHPQHPITDTSNLSWTPPKQTASIKIGDNEPVEVEKCVRIIHYGISTMIDHDTFEAAEQFRKAMKPLVKE